MALLTMTSFVTLDGVMQAPGGPQEDTSGGFTHGGWSFPYADEVFGEFITGVFARADAFLLGRKTYDIFAGYWPKVTDPADVVSGPLNTLPKHVASRTLQQADWHNSSIVRDAVTEVPVLKSLYARELQVHGSSDLAQTLIENDLVDIYHILTFPIALGSGKRLFGSGTVPLAFSLIGQRTSSTGVLISSYQRKGVPTYGSFE